MILSVFLEKHLERIRHQRDRMLYNRQHRIRGYHEVVVHDSWRAYAPFLAHDTEDFAALPWHTPAPERKRLRPVRTSRPTFPVRR
jgi:hypothetical protein